MEANCKLQISYKKLGPLRVKGRMTLIDENNNKASYGLQIPFSKKSICSSILKAYAVFIPTLLLAQSCPSNLGSAFTIAAGAAFAMELGLRTKGHIKRMPLTNDFRVHSEKAITRQEYDIMRKKLNNSESKYSLTMSNCVQLCRRTMDKQRRLST